MLYTSGHVQLWPVMLSCGPGDLLPGSRQTGICRVQFLCLTPQQFTNVSATTTFTKERNDKSVSGHYHHSFHTVILPLALWEILSMVFVRTKWNYTQPPPILNRLRLETNYKLMIWSLGQPYYPGQKTSRQAKKIHELQVHSSIMGYRAISTSTRAHDTRIQRVAPKSTSHNIPWSNSVPTPHEFLACLTFLARVVVSVQKSVKFSSASLTGYVMLLILNFLFLGFILFFTCQSPSSPHPSWLPRPRSETHVRMHTSPDETGFSFCFVIFFALCLRLSHVVLTICLETFFSLWTHARMRARTHARTHTHTLSLSHTHTHRHAHTWCRVCHSSGTFLSLWKCTCWTYSLVQWNWFSGITGCTWNSCIQWRQRTNFTALGCRRGVENVQYATTIKEGGGGEEEAHMRSPVQGLPQWWRHDSRRCACMWARTRPSALSHDGKVVRFRAQKNEKAAWRETMASPGSPLSPLFPLFLFLSFSLSPSLYLSLPSLSLSLSLSLFLSLSLSQSLSLKGHTHRKTVESTLILTVGPLTLHPTASTWVGEIRGA